MWIMQQKWQEMLQRVETRVKVREVAVYTVLGWKDESWGTQWKKEKKKEEEEEDGCRGEMASSQGLCSKIT